jgi:hypothetical protein
VPLQLLLANCFQEIRDGSRFVQIKAAAGFSTTRPRVERAAGVLRRSVETFIRFAGTGREESCNDDGRDGTRTHFAPRPARSELAAANYLQFECALQIQTRFAGNLHSISGKLAVKISAART